MFAAKIFIFLSLLISVSIDDGVISDVNYQIDKHIQGIISDRSVDSNYWFLSQMANSSEWVDQLIVGRISQLDLSKQNGTTSCLFNAFISSNDEGSLSKILNRLYSGSKCIPDSDLFLTFMYELEIDQRLDYIDKVPDSNKQDPILNAYLNRLIGNSYSQDILFQNRSIRLIDQYLFVNHDRSNLQIHKSLIENWYNELLESSRLTEPLDFIKLQTVVTSHHTLDQKFAENYTLLKTIQGNRNFPTTVYKHILFKRIAFTATAYGYYQNALNFYRDDLLPLSRSIMATSDYLIVQQDFATLLFRIGNIKGALTNYLDIYMSENAPSDIRFKSSLYNNLAVSYLNAGFFDQYIQLQLEAYELATEVNSIEYQLQILNNLYIYYKNNSDWNRAKLYLDEAERIAQDQNLSQELASIKLSIATYHRDQLKDYPLSIKLIDELVQELDPDEYYSKLLSAIGELAITYEQLNDYAGILKSREKLLEIARIKDDQVSIIEAKIGLAIQQFRFNKIDEALSTSSIINDLNPDNFEFRLRIQLLYTLSLRLYHTGNLDSAIELLKDTLPELISNLKQSGDMQTGSIYIDPSFRRTFSLLVDFLIEAADYPGAITVLDEFKNLNKASYLNSPLLKSSILSEDELLLDMQISANIEQLRGNLIGAEPARRLELNNELIQLQNQQNILFNKILNNYESKPLDIRYVVSRLDKNESILSYTAIDSSIYVSSISKNSVDIKKLHISSREKIELDQIILEIESGRPDVLRMFEKAQKFVLPFIDNSLENLVVIPDAFLYRIPVEIFPSKKPSGPISYGSTSYLVEDFSVSYSNSIADFILDYDRDSVNNRFNLEFLGFGVTNFQGVKTETGNPLSPLPFARTELLRAQTFFPGSDDSQIFIDNEATKSGLFRLAPDSRIVHLASHSSVHQADPLFSQIYLSDSKTVSSIIPMYAYELFDLNLNTELLVLSSCESGGGSYAQGSGIIGLGRALKFAGAKSLVLNSWSIRDQTAADMMGYFYKYISSGMSKDEALRQAKIDYLNGVNSNPAVWGSLILYGNKTSIYTQFNYIHIFITLIGCIFIFYLGRKFYFKYLI